MSSQQDRLHRTSVGGNTVAGAAGGAFGTAKLRDLHREQYPRTHAVGVRHVGAKAPRLVRIIEGRPGFKTAVVGSTAGAIAAGARRYNEHEERKKELAKSAFGVELVSKAEAEREEKRRIRRGVKQAIHPPAVARDQVESSAVRSVGYQKQTRRLAVEMHSRPGEPYTYRVPPKVAEAAVNAPSKGRAYAKTIRGRYQREPRVRLVDRARLAANPVPEKVQKSAFGVEL